MFFVGWQEMANLVGMTTEELLAAARLPREIVNEIHPRLTTEEVMRFWDALECKAGGRELITLLCSAFNQFLPAPYLAALCCSNLREALHRFAECKPFTGPIRFRFERHKDSTSLYFEWALPPDRLTPFFVLAEFTFILVLAERGTGRPVRPLRAESPIASLIDKKAALDFLGTGVETGPEMRLVFADSDLDAHLLTANPVTHNLLEQFFSEIYNTTSTSRTEKVRLVLQRLMPAATHSLENVAAQINCSPRTLQRELAEEGTTFQELLSETRRDLSLHYLGRAQYSTKETAFLLGYSEPAAFYRAFRRWTGMTPASYTKNNKA